MSTPGNTIPAEAGLPTDPAERIVALWRAAEEKVLSWAEATELAGRAELARSAPPDSVDRLISRFNALAPQLTGRALALAELAGQHAIACRKAGRSNDAQRLCQAIRPVFEQYSVGEQLGVFYMNQAVVLTKCGLLAEALGDFDRALALLQQHASIRLYAACRLKRAAALLNQGRYQEVVATSDEVLHLLTLEASPEEYTGCLLNRATALWRQGRLAEAVAGFDVALPLLKQYAGPEDYANGLANRAGVVREQGKLAEAIADYDLALPLFKQHAPPAEHARCMMLRATVLVQQKAHADALRDFDEALPLLKDHVPPAQFATYLGARAIALRALGRQVEAIEDYDSALSLLKTNAPPAHYAIYLMNRANALRDIGRESDAIADYDQALPLLQAHGQPAEYTRCLVNRAYALYDAGKHVEAVEGFAQARSELRAARQRGRVDETSVEFTTHWNRLFRLAVDSALVCGATDRAHETVCDAKAMVFGDLQQRLAGSAVPEPPDVLHSRDALTEWIRNCAPTEQRVPDNPFAASRASRPDDISRCQAERKAFLTERDQRTRRYLSAWNQHHHAYMPDRLPAEDTRPPTLLDIQDCLPEDWAIIDYWWTGSDEVDYSWSGQDEFIVFLLFKHKVCVHKVPFPLAKLRSKLDRLRESLRSPHATEPNLDALTDLYARLFKPLLPLLREHGIRGLYLVPHDFLHGLPLHAAYNAKSSSYICDEFVIAYLPSAALLPRLPKPNLSGAALLLANPEVGTEHTLPFSHWEGEQLCRLLAASSCRAFIGQTATLTNTKSWDGAGFVLFSCHGHGDAHFAPRSHLRLADDLLLAHDVLYRWPPLKQGALIVLNGCQTGVPDSRAVNEGMGLMTAFLLRGAGVVLATQWNVADGCAAEMVLEFADAMLRRQSSPAEALGMAREHVRRMTEGSILKRVGEVTNLFGEASLERARMNACGAWAYARAGLLDETIAAAALAGPVLGQAGLDAEEQAMRDLGEVSRRRMKTVGSRVSYDSPVFWGAFQLIGRVV